MQNAAHLNRSPIRISLIKYQDQDNSLKVKYDLKEKNNKEVSHKMPFWQANWLPLPIYRALNLKMELIFHSRLIFPFTWVTLQQFC
jgi:hypothetical protein